MSHDHFYLIVFNFKKGSCAILDNVFSKDSFYVTYDNIGEDFKFLDVLFDLYLTTMKHSKRSTMKRVRPVQFTCWMTRRNYTDCGIFLMRHMETYKEGDIDDMDADLADEGEDSDEQQIHLDDLRRKYVIKLLTLDLNKLKPNVYSYLPQYDKLPLEKNMEIDTNEHFDRMQARIILAFDIFGG
ncbi:hypothetical protein LXL04_038101 [Taraxacum kok-saghyz]